MRTNSLDLFVRNYCIIIRALEKHVVGQGLDINNFDFFFHRHILAGGHVFEVLL